MHPVLSWGRFELTNLHEVRSYRFACPLKYGVPARENNEKFELRLTGHRRGGFVFEGKSKETLCLGKV